MFKDKEDWIIISVILSMVLVLLLAISIEKSLENRSLWQQAIKRGYAEEVHTSNGTYYKWKELK